MNVKSIILMMLLGVLVTSMAAAETADTGVNATAKNNIDALAQSREVVPPPNYGRSEAEAIADLQVEINRNNQIIKQDDQNLVNQAQQQNDRFQEFLRNRQQQQKSK